MSSLVSTLASMLQLIMGFLHDDVVWKLYYLMCKFLFYFYYVVIIIKMSFCLSYYLIFRIVYQQVLNFFVTESKSS